MFNLYYLYVVKYQKSLVCPNVPLNLECAKVLRSEISGNAFHWIGYLNNKVIRKRANMFALPSKILIGAIFEYTENLRLTVYGCFTFDSIVWHIFIGPIMDASL